ncbi:MAG: sensor histidine kinase [Campylobacterota bacterium]
MKLTNKISLILAGFSLLLILFASLTYHSYMKHHERLVQQHIQSETKLYKKTILNSVKNANTKFEQKRVIFYKIHQRAREILRREEIGLKTLQRRLEREFNLVQTRLHIYLIDKDLVIYDSTFAPDIGFDLSIVHEATDFLRRSEDDGKIYIANFASQDFLDMSYKLYSYSRLDQQRFLELGFIDTNIYNSFVTLIETADTISLYNITKVADDYIYYEVKNRENEKKKNFVEYQTRVKKEDSAKHPILAAMEKNEAILKSYGDYIKVFTPLYKKNMIEYMGYYNMVIELDIDISHYNAALHDFKRNFWFFVIATLLFWGFVIMFLRKSVTRPIESLLYAMESKQKTVEVDRVHKDELQMLAKQYNTMLDSLNKELRNNQLLLDENKQFIADMVHQIRTPLTVIMTNSSFIEMQGDKQIRKYVQQINSSINMLSNSYEDLAYVISHDSIEYKPTQIALSTFIQQRIRFFQTIAWANNKTISMQVTEGLDLYINDIELERLVDNNLSNAIKHSFAGSEIIVTLAKAKEGLVLEFISSGKTINDAAKIFERNYTEASFNKRSLGLGLFMVKTICEKNGIVYKASSSGGYNYFRYTFANP